jgi:hypothetical protein
MRGMYLLQKLLTFFSMREWFHVVCVPRKIELMLLIRDFGWQMNINQLAKNPLGDAGHEAAGSPDFGTGNPVGPQRHTQPAQI